MSKFSEKINGDRVDEAMQAQGHTQTTLAQAIGLTQGSIYNIISGKKQLSIGKFIELCQVLGRSADYLLSLGDNPVPGELKERQVLFEFASDQEAEIARGLLDGLKGVTHADQLFVLTLLQKLGSNTGPRTNEAIEAGAVIDTLPAPARGALLATIYKFSAELKQHEDEKTKELEFLAEVARERGIDVDGLVAQRFGVRIGEE